MTTEQKNCDNIVDLDNKEFTVDQKAEFIQEVENVIEAIRTGKIEGEYFKF